MTFDVWDIPKRLTGSAVASMSSHQIEEIRARLSQRGSDAVFNAAEAAIYLGRSARTLKRAIDAGMGPARQKNPDVAGTGAVNRHTRYRKEDLDQWAASLYGFATAASGRFATFDALTVEQPWLVAQGRVFCHLLDAGDVDQILEILAQGWVEFFRLDEVLLEKWAGSELRHHYQDQFVAVVARTVDSISSAQQKDELLLATRGTPFRGKA